MSVYSSGLDSLSRGRVRVGGFADPSTPITNKWRGDMQAAIDRIRAKYPGGSSHTVAELLPDVDKAYAMAGKFADDAPSTSLSDARTKAARYNSLALLEVRAGLRVRPKTDTLTPEELAHAVDAMTAPISWLIDAGGPILEQREEEGSRWKTFLWIAGGLVALWVVKGFIDSGVAAKREIVGDRPLFAPHGQVRNPPAWAADPVIWESARVAVEPYAGNYENPEAVTVHVYKQLGGRVS